MYVAHSDPLRVLKLGEVCVGGDAVEDAEGNGQLPGRDRRLDLEEAGQEAFEARAIGIGQPSMTCALVVALDGRNDRPESGRRLAGCDVVSHVVLEAGTGDGESRELTPLIAEASIATNMRGVGGSGRWFQSGVDGRFSEVRESGAHDGVGIVGPQERGSH